MQASCEQCGARLTAGEQVCSECGQTVPSLYVSEQAQVHTRIVSADPERQRQTRLVEVGPVGLPKKLPGTGSAASSDEEIELWGSFVAVYRRLGSLDRLALWCLLAAVLTFFLPWTRQAGQGWVSGIEGWGALGIPWGVVALYALYQRSIAGGTRALLVIQFLGGVAMVAAAVHQALEAKLVNLAFGLYATIVVGAASAIVTLLRMPLR